MRRASRQNTRGFHALTPCPIDGPALGRGGMREPNRATSEAPVPMSAAIALSCFCQYLGYEHSDRRCCRLRQGAAPLGLDGPRENSLLFQSRMRGRGSPGPGLGSHTDAWEDVWSIFPSR